MEIVTGVFAPEDCQEAVKSLQDHGFGQDDLSLMTSASEVPPYLQGDPEKSAAGGVGVGAAAGSTIGALGAWTASTIPGFEAMVVSGLMATTIGGVIGGYLGSLYSVRAETHADTDIREELEAGHVLLLVRSDEENVARAATLMEQGNGRDVATFSIPDDELDERDKN